MLLGSIILIILCAVLLMLIILMQNSKGGVGSSFGASGASQMVGVKKSGDILEKLTWGFMIAILVISIVVNVFLKSSSKKDNKVFKQNTEQNESIRF